MKQQAMTAAPKHPFRRPNVGALLSALLTSAVLASCTTQSAASVDNLLSQNTCGDLLTQLAEKPQPLEFLECNKEDGQVVFSAKYRVPGEQAALVEDFLHQNYGMSRLTFVCCGWEPEQGGRGSFRQEDELDTGAFVVYSVSMYGDAILETEQEGRETPHFEIFSRQEWHKIPYFYVVAEIVKV